MFFAGLGDDPVNWLQSCKPPRGNDAGPSPFHVSLALVPGKRNTYLKLGTKAWFPEAEGKRAGLPGQRGLAEFGPGCSEGCEDV